MCGSGRRMNWLEGRIVAVENVNEYLKNMINAGYELISIEPQTYETNMSGKVKVEVKKYLLIMGHEGD